MDQGRLAAYHAFDEPANDMRDPQPIGIYTIPEVSFVGATESELTRNAVPYEFGISRYRELARGQIAGDSYGMLKLLVSTHGPQVARRPHLRDSGHRTRAHRPGGDGLRRRASNTSSTRCFNYPTFSEAYKVAALDVMNKIRAVRDFHCAVSSTHQKPEGPVTQKA